MAGLLLTGALVTGQEAERSRPAREEALAAALLAAPDEESREVLLRAGDFDGPALATALNARASDLNRAGETDAAGAAARLTASVADRFWDTAARRLAHAALGVHLFNTGEYEQALAEQEKSLALSEIEGNRVNAARARTNMGLALAEMGFYERAEAEYQQAFSLAEAEGSRVGMAIISSNLGMVHNYRGDDLRALQAYERALAIKRPEDKGVEASIFLSNIGQALAKLGRADLGIPYFHRALEDAERSGYRRELPAAMLHLADAERDLGREKEAREWYGKALALARTQGDRRTELNALRMLAGIDRAAGDHAGARTRYVAALEIARTRGLRRQEAGLRRLLAALHRDEGQPEEARQQLDQALALAREIGSPDILAHALTLSAELLLAKGERAAAAAALKEAISLLEDWRARIGGGDASVGFLEDKLAPYHAMVGLLVDQGRGAEAFTYAERAKARVLLDALHAGVDDVTAAMTEAESRRERTLEDRLAALNRQAVKEAQREKPRPDRLREMRTALEAARSEYDTFRALLYAAHPELREKRGETAPLTLGETGELLDGRSTVLLEYVVGETSVHLLVIARGDTGAPELSAFRIRATRAELESRVRAFRDALARRDLEFHAEARRLYDLLLAPARTLLAGRPHLLIVPDGALWELPFQALQTERRRFVIEQHAVSYAPSLSALRAMQHRASTEARPAGVLVVANPTVSGTRGSGGAAVLMGEGLAALPEAERQASALRQLYGRGRTEVLLGAQAEEGRTKAVMGTQGILHFATHGLLNDQRPLYSQLVLATPAKGADDDGLLEAREIMKMRLGASMAVLSACETGRGRVAPGEGLIGLTWAFFVAGVPATVVSQWKVESASTTDLMVGFHRELRAGRTRADALQRASVRLLARPQHRHPFYWAGFVVVGDPGR